MTAVLALSGSVLAGCTSDSPPDPAVTAGQLATGLGSGDLAAVPFDGSTGAAATESVRNAVGDLKDLPRAVTVTDVTKASGDDKKATATLQWTWDVSNSAADWVYSTKAALVLADDKTWHVQWSPTLVEPKLTASEHFAVDRSQGKRGEILDGDGNVLVGLRDVYRVGIDKGKIAPEQVAASSAALATLIGVDPTAYAQSTAAAGPKQFVVAITLRVEDPRIAGKVSAVQAIPGGTAMPDQAMLAPSSTFARALLGTVGLATAEIVAKSAGRVGANDTVGLSGLQASYDAYLAGQPGLKIRAVGKDAAGTATNRLLFTQDAIGGKPLRTTLDVAAQNAAEATIAGVPVSATLVAIRPSTGEILAAANNPATNGQAMATTGRAAPGSTFKVISSLALLRAGLTPETAVPCTETLTVDGRVFKNYSDYPAGHLGSIPLRAALAYSCNTAFMSQHDVVSQDDLADAAAALGLGVDFDAGFPSFFGSVPRAATATEHAASLIGQGKVEASALAMATVVSSIVKGSAVTPRVVDRPPAASMPSAPAPGGAGAGSATAAPGASGGPGGQAGATGGAASGTAATPGATAGATAATTPAAALPTAPPAPAKPLTPAEVEALRSMLASVVAEGSGKVVADVGAQGAKTGTAQYGTQDPPQTHAWMIAMRGDLAVAVFVQDGTGATTAGPLMHAFLQAFAG